MTDRFRVTVENSRTVKVVSEGPQGPQGPPGPEGPPGNDTTIWHKLTQAEYDALPSPDPAILYIIVN